MATPVKVRTWVSAAAGTAAVVGLVAGLYVAVNSPTGQPPAPGGQAALTPTPDAVVPESTVPPVVQPTAVETNSPFAAILEPVPTVAARTEPVTHEVQAGEVLWQIAERYGLRTETLLWANSLENADLILAGSSLTIPTEDGVYYTVQPDERLANIATRYGVDVEKVAAANQLASADGIQAGMDIFLPGARPLYAETQPPAVAASSEGVESMMEAAGILPPVPLPPNIDTLLSAGWLRAASPTTLYKTADSNAIVLHEIPEGVVLERLDGPTRGRIQVRDPGDGRTRQGMTGWVDAMALDLGRAPASWELPLSYPAGTAMDIAQVFAPYRSQLDGSPYAGSNCGPSTIGMALAAFGVSVPSQQLRAEVLDDQHIWGNYVGTLITSLANVVEGHGLNTYDLYANGGGLYQWSTDDIRQHLNQGRPVVAQVNYRSLPGRGNVQYFEDHYILVTGVVPDGFLYSDPINSDGLGWDRFMTTQRLETAMSRAIPKYAHAAFAVGQ